MPKAKSKNPRNKRKPLKSKGVKGKKPQSKNANKQESKNPKNKRKSLKSKSFEGKKLQNKKPINKKA